MSDNRRWELEDESRLPNVVNAMKEYREEMKLDPMEQHEMENAVRIMFKKNREDAKKNREDLMKMKGGKRSSTKRRRSTKNKRRNTRSK